MRKIKGWAWPDTEKDLERTGVPIYSRKVKGTVAALLLVSTDDKVPEVVTKDQVRAMLMDAKQQIMDSICVADSHIPFCIIELEAIAAKHGITL